ncbi:MAG: hypothetical protein U0V49_04040 [Saprospiraceae bacterium]
MKLPLQISNQWKVPGWILLIIGSLTGTLKIIFEDAFPEIRGNVFAFAKDEIFGQSVYFGWIQTDLVATLCGIVIIIGGLLLTLAREKNEDEFIRHTRLSSLMWAFAIHYILLLLAFIFIYNTSFLHVMTFGMFTLMIIFIARFHLVLYFNKRKALHEK